ncbi:unnamed protein product [Cuscuta campestris]|uniref:Uncharacterized protein n=1 Tax=Cuscuta campestris TaxID=132261 RepID=A0A484MJF4_9ASTE|nr:unnamed protein product [Cuscuta campestris]
MDAGDQLARRRRKGVVERWLGMRGISCCGASWGFLPATTAAVTDDDGVEESGPAPSCASETTAGSGMNLAAALEAERQYMAVRDGGRTTPARISLMRLLEETAEGGDGVEMQSGGGVLLVHGEEKVRSVYTVRPHLLQSVFGGAPPEPRLLSPLQPIHY